MLLLFLLWGELICRETVYSNGLIVMENGWKDNWFGKRTWRETTPAATLPHARARAHTYTSTFLPAVIFIMFLDIGKAGYAVRLGYYITAAVTLFTIMKLFSHFI